ncbi:ATP-binding protein [Candidatus Zixiibacteriota bacterium]
MNDFAVFEIQKTVRRILYTAAARNRLAHAYLFYGLEGTGKWAAAVEAAKLLMCPETLSADDHTCDVCRRITAYNHPDVHWVIPGSAKEKPASGADAVDRDGQTTAQLDEQQRTFAIKRADPWASLEYPRRPYITMAKVRALQSILARTPAEGPRKIGIIINAENMRPDAQSVLLKTIEEPPPDSFILITTSSKSTLLPTILSRCQPMRFVPLPLELIRDRLIAETGITESAARRAAELSGGGWARARRLADEEWQVWFAAADKLLKTAISGSVDDVILVIDTVFKQRPDLSKVLFFFELWYSMLHRAGTAPASLSPNTPGDHGSLAAIHESCAILDQARTAVIGNVTPRTAIAAALLEVHELLRTDDQAVLFGSRDES